MAVLKRKFLKEDLSPSLIVKEDLSPPLIESNTPIADNTEADNYTALPAANSLHRKRPGWFSPTYSQSRRVALNPDILEANRCVGHLENTQEVEHYKSLRTQILQRTNGIGGKTVMVTSSLPAEGKTLTAINLALTFAMEFRFTSLLVDCDFRKQQIHKMLGFEGGKGLYDYFEQDCPISELMVWPGIEKFTVISCGSAVAETNEFLGSPGMGSLVHELKSRYAERYVFFDAPPVLSDADTLALAQHVDYILLTVRAGSTSMQDVNRAIKLLPREKLLGSVMNYL